MAATREMVDIALKTRPHAACLVPEKRTERTTEGGLDVVGQRAQLAPVVRELKHAGIRVSLFIGADPTADRDGGRAGRAGDRNPYRRLVRRVDRRPRRAKPKPNGNSSATVREARAKISGWRCMPATVSTTAPLRRSPRCRRSSNSISVIS